MADQTIMQNGNTIKLTAKDFASDIDVKWCPGCGDYSILAQVQRSMPSIGIPRENIAFVAGIGCSSRFPYYMSTYGFHGIHGRAPAVAEGLKMARPELSVWVAAGDGDLLSIGGNHFVHLLRRNLDINILLFNNRIYGLTKGQYSPTSEYGKVTKSSPVGVIDYPFNPASLAIGANGTFVARSMYSDAKHLQDMIMKSAKHKGTSFLEIFQNCNIYNDGAFDQWTEKDLKPDNVVFVEDGKPLVFGKNKEKGIKLDGLHPVVVSLEDGKHSVNDLLVHDVKSRELGFLLAELGDIEGMPVPMGVLLDSERYCYEDDMVEQINEQIAKKGKGDLEKLLFDENVWEIK